MGEMVLMSLSGWQSPPTIEQVAQQLQVETSAIDREFGVIEVDIERKIFAIRVDSAALERGAEREKEGVSGPFSDPRIAPFGNPE